MARVYSASSRLAFAAASALWVWAACTAFVSSGNGVKGLRGVERNSHAEYAPFPTSQETGEPGARSSLTSGLQAVLLAGVFGLVVGLAPVRAEEAAAPAEAPAAPSGADVTEILSNQLKNKDAGRTAGVSRSKARKTLQKKTSSVAESTSKVGVSVSQDPETGKKKRVIFSPADELDEDELSPTRPNQPLLALIFATPVTIYLTFYVLGSLNII